MMNSTERLIIADEHSMLDKVIAENQEAKKSAVLAFGDHSSKNVADFIKLGSNKTTKKGAIQMNTLRAEANEKFEAFLNTVNPDIISEEAKEVLMAAPTQWARFIEIAVANYSTQTLEDLEERNQFSAVFHNLHEKIAVSTSMVQFAEWLQEVGLSFESHLSSLKLVNRIEDRDGYDTLELFVEKFYQ